MFSAAESARSVIQLKDFLGEGRIRTGEPQRSYMFELEIIDNVSGQSYRNLKFYVKDVTVPSKSKDPIMVEYMGNKLIWSGKDSSSHEFTATFWDDEDLTVTHFMNNWYELSGDSRYGDSLGKQEFTRDIKIVLKPTLDVGATGTFVLKDCFPTQIGEISLSYDDSNVMEIPMTFSYDYVKIKGAEGGIIEKLEDAVEKVINDAQGKIKSLF